MSDCGIFSTILFVCLIPLSCLGILYHFCIHLFLFWLFLYLFDYDSIPAEKREQRPELRHLVLTDQLQSLMYDQINSIPSTAMLHCSEHLFKEKATWKNTYLNCKLQMH